MAVKYRNLDELLADWNAGNIARYQINLGLFDFLDESNVHLVIAGLPADHRDEFLEWARRVAIADPDELITLWGGTALGPHPEGPWHEREAEVLRALRAYFSRDA
jgi:hypothetical protein